jgi:hypothetical protein
MFFTGGPQGMLWATIDGVHTQYGTYILMERSAGNIKRGQKSLAPLSSAKE